MKFLLLLGFCFIFCLAKGTLLLLNSWITSGLSFNVFLEISGSYLHFFSNTGVAISLPGASEVQAAECVNGFLWKVLYDMPVLFVELNNNNNWCSHTYQPSSDDSVIKWWICMCEQALYWETSFQKKDGLNSNSFNWLLFSLKCLSFWFLIILLL